MRQRPPATPDDIDITSLWSSIKMSLPRIILASGLAGALTYSVLSLVAPRYMSEARLTIEARASSDPFKDPRREGGSAESINVRMDREAINTHVQALQSPDLAAKVAEQQKLAERKEFNAKLGSVDLLSALLRIAGIGAPKPDEDAQDLTLAAYFKRLEVYSPKESRSIVIRFSSIDKELAANVANDLAETYRASLATEMIIETDEVQKALEPKIAKLKEELATAEAEVERFKGEANLFKGGQQSTGLNEQQLAELTAELTKAKAARSEADARAKSAREMMKLGSADALPDVQKSPLIQNLVQQRVRLERQVDELAATLLPGHPRMQQLNADLAGLKKQINGEVAKVVESLEKEAKVTALREESISKSLDEIKSRVVMKAPDEAKLRALEANAKAKRTEIEGLQAKYEASRARANEMRAVPVEARIDSKARPAGQPYFPKKGPFALLASMAVCVFGIAWSLTRALINGARSGTAGDRLPVAAGALRPLASVEPHLSVAAPLEKAAGAEPVAEHFVAAATVEDVAKYIVERAPRASGCRTLVTGEGSDIDPGQTAIDLVKALSSAGQSAILIDWNPDASGLAQMLGLRRTPGATELMRNAVKFEAVIQQLPQSDAHFIASGAAMPFGSDVPSPEHINLVLDALDEAYAHIVTTGPYEAVRNLFEVIEGRFDIGVTVTEPGIRTNVLRVAPRTFLGYEVADIELIRLEKKGGAVPLNRILKATGRARADAHPV
jgi:uncharacterized protein involved in exopolysaccharide biosynthesis